MVATALSLCRWERASTGWGRGAPGAACHRPPQARTQRERPFSPASMESGSKRRILAVGTSGVHPAAQPPAPSWLVVTEAGPFWKCAADVPVTLPNPCLALVAFS